MCAGKHFKTIGGACIGKSISDLIADIFLIWFEEEFVFNEGHEIQPYFKAWKIYCDDIWSGGSAILDSFS